MTNVTEIVTEHPHFRTPPSVEVGVPLQMVRRYAATKRRPSIAQRPDGAIAPTTDEETDDE